MISVTKLFEFEAAHFLPNHPGLCKNLHGHSYKMEVEVTRVGKPLNDCGMVCDFKDLKNAIQPVIELLDHSYLNDKMSRIPTAENMLEMILSYITWPENIRPVRIRLWETSTSYAEWKDIS